ncbi:response regulator [Adhaeretor mobilis]|uniref:histidine kinase n=1 Tax=Adhaeretor mobilis TaxID=1930276 RepID=A0A517MTU4_9BACT|nr:response regulator [Adhaeretor mobilis]QDS98306.1 Non-motile and phage-resistance protein [Adhaeretor mobilis]
MITTETRILLIDDDTGDAFITRESLSRIGGRHYDIDHAASMRQAKSRLGSFEYDVILLDLNLPESSGPDTLRRLCELTVSKTPVIVLTGLDDEEAALQMLAEGAADFICKSDIRAETLSRSIQYTMRRQQLLVELQSANTMLSEKNRRLNQLYKTAQQFVDNVSHEFRTPLTVIREFTSIVRDGLDGPVTERQAEHLEKVIYRTDDLSLMVDDMLDISKLEAGLLAVWRRPCAVEELVRNVEGIIASRAKARGIEFTIDIPADLPEAFCDEEKARRVLINLAINAIKFTPSSGSVKIWAKSNADQAEIVLGVTDTGSGISQENLSSIFGRFRQVDSGIHSSTKGFGLGLSIARELVYLNLGEMDVQSQIGIGSTFTFTLPTNDLAAIVDRYLERIESKRTEGTSIALVRARAEGVMAKQSEAVVDEFLQRAVCGGDLAVRSTDQQWLIAKESTESELKDTLAKIEGDWSAFKRNCPGVELPGIRFELDRVLPMPECHFELRQAALNGLNTERHQETSEPTSDHRTVLVVDDNEDVSRCLSLRLEAAGYEVTAAYDGEAGYNAAVANRPDAVVLDVCMPKKDGLTVLRELRQNPLTKNTPIVMLSASIRDQHGALESGANFFVQKPYESHEVLSAIKSSMDQQSQAKATETEELLLECVS